MDSSDGVGVVDAHAFEERKEGDLADVAVEGLGGLVLDLGLSWEREEALQGFEHLFVNFLGEFVVNCYKTTIFF